MSDLINRQAAIDALIEWYGCEPNDIEWLKEIIEAKPSAEPNIVRCKDCIHNSLNRNSGNAYCDLGIGLYQLPTI